MDAFSKDPSILGGIWLPHSWVLIMNLRVEMNSMLSKRNYIVGTWYTGVKWSRGSFSLMIDVWSGLGVSEHLTPSRWSGAWRNALQFGAQGGSLVVETPSLTLGIRLGQTRNWTGLCPTPFMVFSCIVSRCFHKAGKAWFPVTDGLWWAPLISERWWWDS